VLRQCRRTIERLPWFLHGTLPEAESADVRSHLNACAACREEHERVHAFWPLASAHPSAETLVRHARQEWESETERTVLAGHLRTCGECAEDVALAGNGNEWPQAVAADAARRTPPAWWTWAPAAAAVLLAVGLTLSQVDLARRRDENRALSAELAQWRARGASAGALEEARAQRARAEAERVAALAQVNELTRHMAGQAAPQANITVAELYSRHDLAGLRAGGQALNEVPAPAEPRPLLVVLFSRRDPRQGPHTVEWRDARGRLVWSLTGLRPTSDGRFNVLLPARAWSGSAQLRLLHQASGTRVADYSVRFTQP
jgi:hypothetical protein